MKTRKVIQEPSLSLEALWKMVVPSGQLFDPVMLTGLPNAARRYLLHAIAPGTPLASAVRLHMHGEIKLKGWFPFTAEQVIAWDQGMIWSATVRMHGLPITGFDRLTKHKGAMQWKILGLLPLMHASGEDITRSGAGRILAESVWLPSALCRKNVTWTENNSSSASACVAVEGEHTPVTLITGDTGHLQSVALKRWGNPEGGAYGYFPFGGVAEKEAAFDGYTIPTRLRVGWYFGTPRFDTEGEFFRCSIDHAEFR